MPNPAPTHAADLKPGDAVTLTCAPSMKTRHLIGRPAEIMTIETVVAGGRGHRVATIRCVSEDGVTPGDLVQDVFASYLRPLAKEKQKRRPPLRLHAPKDDRSEAERMAEGLALIRGWGYEYLGVGQSRKAAICHQCTRKAKRRVRIVCKDCGSFGFSPSTSSTPGTPDSFAWHPTYPGLLMAPIEWKDGPNGDRTDEQAALERAGRIAVVWDELSLCRALHSFELLINVTPRPELVQWLAAHDQRMENRGTE